MASTMYDSLTYDISTGAVVPSTDTLYVMLVNSYSPNARTHTKRSDVTGEVSSAGYTAGGAALAAVTATLDATTNDRTTFTSTNPSWSGVTLTATGAVVYKHRGGASSADNLVSYIDFGGSVTATGATFTITSFATNGFLLVNKV